MPVRGALVIVIGVVAALLVAAFAGVPSGQASASRSARAACPGAASLQSGAQVPATLRCLVNWTRARHGRPPVRVSTALQRAARQKARDVIRCGSFSHTPCGRAASAAARAAGYRIRSWGENLYVAEGEAGTPLAALEAWLGSPGHRAVLLHAGFAHIGVAVVTGVQVAGIAGARLTVLELGSPL